MTTFWHICKLTYVQARRVMIAIVGFTVVLIGVAMLVLPGPGLVVIPIGLAILAVEFAFARRWLKQVKEAASKAASYGKNMGTSRTSKTRSRSPVSS